MGDTREFLRHTLATVAYRGAKAIRGAGAEFAEYGAGDTGRTPVKILAHIGDLMEWGLSMAEGSKKWHDSSPLDWEKSASVFLRRSKGLTTIWPRRSHWKCRRRNYFRGRLPMRLRTWGRLRCCGGWRA